MSEARRGRQPIPVEEELEQLVEGEAGRWLSNGGIRVGAGGLAGALLMWAIMQVPSLFREGGEQNVQLGTLQKRVEKLENWGPDRGDRYLASNARSDWQEHDKDHRRLELKVDRLLLKAGIDPLTVRGD